MTDWLSTITKRGVSSAEQLLGGLGISSVGDQVGGEGAAEGVDIDVLDLALGVKEFDRAFFFLDGSTLIRDDESGRQPAK